MKVWTLVFASVLFLFCGCEKQTPEAKHLLRLSMSDDPVSLDPRQVRSLKDLTLMKHLYEGLMRLDADGKPKAAIATSYTLSPDLKTYTFQLREALWSDGTEVSASDFVCSWEEALSKEFASDYAYMLYPIAGANTDKPFGAKALDKRILQVTLERPTPYFIELVAFPTYFPVNKKKTNGPFILKKWDRGSLLQLEKNPRYWDVDGVNLEGIQFAILADNNTESLLFEKGELDWLGQPISNNLSTELIGKLKESGALCSYSVAGTAWFRFHTQKAPFTHVKVRQAFARAINRQEIISHVLLGNQIPATSPLSPTVALSEKPHFQDGDITTAKKLFQEALDEMGLTKESCPKIVLSYPPTERNKKIAQLVQQQWKRAFGVPVVLESVEKQLYRQNIRTGVYQVGLGDWIADYNDPIAFLELFSELNDAENGSGMNGTRWHSEEFSALLALSQTESDPEVRAGLLRQAEKILIDAMPIAPLYHYCFDYQKKKNLDSVVLSPLGIADFKKAKIL